MLEGSAKIRAKRAVYDPQSAFEPETFSANGSVADELAIVLNLGEGRRLTGEAKPEAIATRLLELPSVAAVVVKMGPRGAYVRTKAVADQIPAWRTRFVFPIGSGDVFAAMFASCWGHDGADPVEAAHVASRATAYYCSTQSLPIPTDISTRTFNGVTAFTPAKALNPNQRQIYLAAPFFSIEERWLVEEVRDLLHAFSLKVFSPLHDVGHGSADDVVEADIAGIEGSQVVFAIVNGLDPGTLFEIGYARAKKIPVIVLVQNEKEEDLKMLAGTTCEIHRDLVTAVYSAYWRAMES